MISELSPNIYRAKIETFEEIFGRQQIDQGGHWKKQPLSPDITLFASQLKSRFGPIPLVVDEGSGSGEHTIQLAERFGLKVIGLEITFNGVQQSRKLVRQEGLSENRVEFVIGNMLAQPFQRGAVEGFHSFCALCHLHRADWPTYFQQLAEITIPGALGIMVEFCGEDDEFYGVPIKEANIGWLEFRDGFVNLETRKGEKYSRPHNYPDKYETFNWWFGSVADLQETAGRYFRVNAYLWDHPEPKPGQIGKRYYLNALLERI